VKKKRKSELVFWWRIYLPTLHFRPWQVVGKKWATLSQRHAPSLLLCRGIET
jgi:hypothetical protein